jgi:CRISPR-associated protein Cmr1
MEMKVLKYQVCFLTPAFLGDADKSGRWRTPPFKAQLRQWWRVAYAAKSKFCVDVADMRKDEGLLFGNAWLSHNEYRKSLVMLRLDRWEEGKLKKAACPKDVPVIHPEVGGGDKPIGSALYLGYGPLTYDKDQHRTAIKAVAAIQDNESATLSIAYPKEYSLLIEQALWLMNQFGTVGGRSRNGWGSYILKPEPRTATFSGNLPLRPWRECLKLDWPHAIGKDDKGKALIWQTTEHNSWKSLMKTLAEIKIGLRTKFRFRVAGKPEERHWLSYPVTHHDVPDWENLRLPNSLRFKVRKIANDKLVGIIFHMPCMPPKFFKPDRSKIEKVWNSVHNYLDSLQKQLERIGE